MSDPDSSGVVLHGAAGVGKSRIAREALARAAGAGSTTHWAVGTASARALPLGALTAWMTAEMDGPQLVRLMVDALTTTSHGAAVIVGVDDVHLLDDLSAFVLHQIARRRTAKLVLTLRDGETVPPGVQEIWAAGEFHRIDLQPLSADETAGLLSVMKPRPCRGRPPAPGYARDKGMLELPEIARSRCLVREAAAAQ